MSDTATFTDLEEPFIDPGLLAWFAMLTTDERLDWLQDFVDSAISLRPPRSDERIGRVDEVP